MSNLHQCDICGFTDKQDDIYQTESGAWHHYECELDSLQPKEKQETDDDSDAVVDREEREGRERDLQLERDFNDNHGFHE